jgi:hypothetical protein
MVSYLELWFATWVPVAGIALGIATILVALVYMIGSALMNDRMKGWAKLELFEIIYSAIIIALALGSLGVIDSIVQGAFLSSYGGAGPQVYVHEIERNVSLCGDGSGKLETDPIANSTDSIYHNIPACHIRLGMWYLNTVFREASDLAYRTYIVYTYTSMAADFAINFEFLTEASGMFTFTPWRGFFTMGNTIKSMTFDYAVKIMLLNKFQEIFLAFIAKAAFPGLFVVGVILRTFTFTRKLGGLLLALAIALYYIFPAFYAFGGLVVLDLKEQVKSDTEFQAICSKLGTKACEDPPIANALYVNGSIPMPGGNLDTSVALAEKEKQGKMSKSERIGAFEKGETNPLYRKESGEWVDFGKISEGKKQDNMDTARKSTNTWFTDMSRQSKFDGGISIAFAPGGPIDALSRLAFFSVFFALFGILATIAGIRSLSITFGGDIEIAGLTHLI